MDDHEVHTGEGLDKVRNQFLRHEFMWSDHCITGARLGWGITASSIPNQKDVLTELEKIAANASKIEMQPFPIEELAYSQDYGFLKLVMEETDPGADERANKRVCIYQQEFPTEEQPEAYLAPSKTWKDQAVDGYLIPEEIETLPRDVLEKFKDTDFYDRLPELLRAIYWTIFGKITGLNFLYDRGNNENGRVSRETMNLVHHLLPLTMRRRAVYLSYTKKVPEDVPFYFSDRKLQETAIHIYDFKRDVAEEWMKGDVLDDYFFYHMAKYYVMGDPYYSDFFERTDDYIRRQGYRPETLRKLEWVFYETSLERGENLIDKESLFGMLPELYYWSSRDPFLQEYVDKLREHLHEEDWTSKQEILYAGRLLRGFTKSSKKLIEEEMCWILRNRIKEDGLKNMETAKTLYQFAFKRNSSIGTALASYAGGLSEDDSLTEEEKKVVERLTESIANNIEESKEEKQKKQKKSRGHKEKSTVGEKKDPDKTASDNDEIKTADTQQVGMISLPRFLINSFSIGFLTGCVIYLSHYSVLIGHYKIALGMAGMWILIILNQTYKELQQDDHYTLWKGIGFYLIEGLLIERVAALFMNQKIRLAFFLILGIIAVLIELGKIISYNLSKNKKRSRHDA
ncbi:MAG: hypothetical protein U0K57_06695 [Lachnospiraceae bacterium]|nr:hypothetical protein [Lachnospiraceae bacterium]